MAGHQSHGEGVLLWRVHARLPIASAARPLALEAALPELLGGALPAWSGASVFTDLVPLPLVVVMISVWLRQGTARADEHPCLIIAIRNEGNQKRNKSVISPLSDRAFSLPAAVVKPWPFFERRNEALKIICKAASAFRKLSTWTDYGSPNRKCTAVVKPWLFFEGESHGSRGPF